MARSFQTPRVPKKTQNTSEAAAAPASTAAVALGQTPRPPRSIDFASSPSRVDEDAAASIGLKKGLRTDLGQEGRTPPKEGKGDSWKLSLAPRYEGGKSQVRLKSRNLVMKSLQLTSCAIPWIYSSHNIFKILSHHNLKYSNIPRAKEGVGHMTCLAAKGKLVNIVGKKTVLAKLSEHAQSWLHYT